MVSSQGALRYIISLHEPPGTVTHDTSALLTRQFLAGCPRTRRGAKLTAEQRRPSGGMADAGDSKSPGGNPV